MKSEWNTYRLEDLCTFHNGLWKGKKPPYIKVGVIRNTNFTKEGILDTTDIPTLDVEEKQYKTRKLQYGDIILEKSGGGPKQPVGRVVIFDLDQGEYSLSNFTSAIRIKDKERLTFQYLHKYLYYFYITSNTEGMQSHSTGIRNLDFTRYKSIQIPVPPIVEQKRIVYILDDVFKDASREKNIAERNLQNAKDLFESYLDNTFNNPNKSFLEISLKDAFVIDPPKNELKKVLESNDLVSFVPMEYVQTNSKYFLVEKEKPLQDVIKSYTYFRNEDVLLAKITPCYENGKLGIASNLKNGVGFGSSEYIVFRKKNIVSPEYLYYYLHRKAFRDEGANNMHGAVGHKRVSKEFINNYKIKYPVDIDIQNNITKILDDLYSDITVLQSVYMKKTKIQEELKKSVLNKAFKGEL